MFMSYPQDLIFFLTAEVSPPPWLARQPQALNRYLRKLQRIADEHGVAVVITNQAVAVVISLGKP